LTAYHDPGKSNTIQELMAMPELKVDTAILTDQGKTRLQITVNLPDEGEFNRQVHRSTIDLDDMFIYHKKYIVYMNDHLQLQEHFIKRIDFDADLFNELTDPDYFKTFNKVSVYKSGEVLVDKPMLNQKFELEGYYYRNEKTFKLDEIKTKYILLDYFYSSCYPCAKLMRAIHKMEEDYDMSDLTILGVDGIDADEKGKRKLAKFIEDHKLKKPVIIENLSDIEEKGIRAYPTLVLLNDKKEIIYFNEGFSEDIVLELVELMDLKLKE
jgi:thiol-disulfide isomerase/thioredoxin